jgi:murein DD-endopeptidase MepM/ murein hydrolase activator NlpD
VRLLLTAALAALLFPASAAAHTDAGRQLAFRWPAAGTITSPFGQDGYRWHSGLDIGILRSLDVRAASAGIVTEVGFVDGYAGYGNVVVVALGGGFSTLYAHLAQPLARRGQLVWPGERIGVAGCTGWCTGTHLHFELRYLGRPMNPLPLIVDG